MKGNPPAAGGPFESKPTWSNTSGCSATSAFFVCGGMECAVVTRDEPMDQPASTKTHQISHAAGACGIDDIEAVASTRELACTTDTPTEASARTKAKEISR